MLLDVIRWTGIESDADRYWNLIWLAPVKLKKVVKIREPSLFDSMLE